MRYPIMLVLFILTLMFIGCDLLSEPVENEPLTVLNCYTCDSTGTPKSVFGRHERIGFGFTEKNISNTPLAYKKVEWIGNLFAVVCASEADSIIPGLQDFFPEDAWGEHVLLPGEQLEQMTMYPPPLWVSSGKCTGYFSFYYRFHTDGVKSLTRDEKANTNQVRFEIRDE